MLRADCLDEAKRCICGEREEDYGSPENSFRDIAKLWSAYLGVVIDPHDVAVLMALLKIGRIKKGIFKADSYVDCAGYIACAMEIADKM